MRTLSVAEVEAAQMGRDIGRICKDYFVRSTSQMRRLLRQPDHPLRQLLALVMHARPHTSRRYNWDDVMSELCHRREHMGVWMRRLLETTMATYRALRHAAAPRSDMPLMEMETGIRLPREVRRALKHGGVHTEAQDLDTIHEEAVRMLRTLWRSLNGVYAVLWFDNCYKPRYIANPDRNVGTLNSTVVSVLHTTPLAGYQGLPPLAELVRRGHAAADAVCREHVTLVTAVANLRRLPLTRKDFRVPLDINREHVRSLQWRPLSMNDDCVGTQAELCASLRSARYVLENAGLLRPMPVLLDENICYRLWKMAYSRLTQEWDVAAYLRDMPLLYGVWHPYKHVMETIHRKFLPLFAYLQHGPLVAGDTVPSVSLLPQFPPTLFWVT